MDAKDRIAFQNAIMADVRRLLDVKFKGSSEELSDDSKVAIQQLVNMNSALRDEFNRLAAGAKVTSTCVEELQKKVAALESTPVSSRAPADIANLKSSLVKVQDALASDQTKTRLANLEKSISELTPIVAGLGNGGANNGANKRSAFSAVPSPSLTPDPNSTAPPASTPTPSLTGPLEAKNDDPNAPGGPATLEVKSNDVNRRLTSLEGRIKAIPQPIPYDDAPLIKRVEDVENSFRTLSDKVNQLAQISQIQPVASIQAPPAQILNVDLTPLQTSLAALEGKVNALAGNAAAFQPFDATPLVSRITKLEEDAQRDKQSAGGNSNHTPTPSALGGLFGIGSAPPDIAFLKAKVEALEANFQALVRVGVSKGEFEPVAQELIALKAKVEFLLRPAQPTPVNQ